MNRTIHVGVFENEGALLAAIGECQRLRMEILDAHTPYPVHGIERALGLRRTRLPVVCFGFGFVGLAFGLWLQYWTSASDWPLNVGGKPFDSLPAFLPVAFELMVLFAGLGAALTFFARSRLYPGKAAPTGLVGVTDDRFALVVRGAGPAVPRERIQEMWAQTGAVDHREELEEPS